MATSCFLLFTLAFFPTTRAGNLRGTVCQDMWNKAVNTLNITSELEVESTGSTAPLFHVKGTGTGKIHQPVFVKMKELLDTYFGTGDTSTKATEFIDTITVPGTAIEIAFKYLQRVGIVDNTKTLDQFKPILRKPWFDEYKKPGPGKKHSGFEHVFVGDLEGTQFKGFHNWYQFLLEQKASKISNVNDPTFKGSTQPAFMSCLRFTWRGATKGAASSLFVGTSPAFDLALFTVCFMLFKDQTCTCNIGMNTIIIQTYAVKSNPDLIATAYPAIVIQSSKPQASQVQYLNNDEPSRQKYHKCYGILPAKRQECGYFGIQREECEIKRDCCFDHSIANVPFCYKGNP